MASYPATVRHTIADLDLTYYVPCNARGRAIAWMGVSRTEKGDFLSSDDVELLVTLAGYVGIAIENARLYRSLQRKADEYERLKEFSENIVESINVGILAADLEDRVESWNNQLERLTGVGRDEAVGRRLRDLLPTDLIADLDKMKHESGIHNIYKFEMPAAHRFPNCKQKQNHDRTDVNQHQCDGQEFCLEKHPEGSGLREGQYQIQRSVNRIACRNDTERRKQHHR